MRLRLIASSFAACGGKGIYLKRVGAGPHAALSVRL